MSKLFNMFFAAIVIVVVALACLKLYFIFTHSEYTIPAEISKSTILITGPSFGIGYEISKELASYGATIHMLCLNEKQGQKAAQTISDETENERVFAWHVNLGKLSSVREFAKKYLESGQPVDVLINNAEAYFNDRQLTEDGLEKSMAIGFYGHFLLTNLLLDRIKECVGRIVNITSHTHRWANLTIENHDLHKHYNGLAAYSNSKLAMVLFTKQLAKQLGNYGVTVNCCRTGALMNDAVMNFFSDISPNNWKLLPLCFLYVLGALTKNAKEGSSTPLYLATSNGLTGISGQYFSECEIVKTRVDEKLARQFMEIASKLTYIDQ